MNIAKLNTAYDGGLILNTGSGGGGNSGGGEINNKWSILAQPPIADGKTRLYLDIDSPVFLYNYIVIQSTVVNDVKVDWGDGTEWINTKVGQRETPVHTYTRMGIYCITIESLGGNPYYLGATMESYNSVLGSTNGLARKTCFKAEVGESVPYLKNSFHDCIGLMSVYIPEGLIEISQFAFSSLTQRISLTIPSSVTMINNRAFFGSTGLTFVDFSKMNTVPQLSTEVFSNILTKKTKLDIIVPDNLYEEWINATNWSEWASIIIKKSDRDTKA